MEINDKNIQIVKLRDFQYRLLLNKVPTNVDLTIWKMLDNEDCTFCRTSPETIMHLFYECIFVKRLWKFFCRLCDVRPEMITKDQILCNNFIQHGNVINEIGLIIKQLVYRCRCLNKNPNISMTKQEIKLIYNIQTYMCKSEAQTKKHLARWANIDHTLLMFTEI